MFKRWNSWEHSFQHGGPEKLESHEISSERHPRVAQTRAQSVTWNLPLSSVWRVLLSTYIPTWASLWDSEWRKKRPFVQKSVFTNSEGQWVQSWHLCLPVSAAGQGPGQRYGGSGRAPPVAALSCLCWHSPTRRWSSPLRPGPDGRHWRATVHTGRWALDLQRESQARTPQKPPSIVPRLNWLFRMVKPLLAHQRGVFPGELFPELNGRKVSLFF